MENTHSSAAVQSAPKKLRYFMFGPLIFLFSTLLSISAFVAYSTSRIPPRALPNPVIHPMIIYSPFTLHRGNIRQAAEEPLGVPIYPGAVPLELSTFAWGADHSSPPSTSTGLVMVRLEVKAPSSAVSSWYKENFPRPYSQLRKEQILSGPAKEKWFQELDASIDNDTVFYQAAASDGTRGAIIQSGTDSDSSFVTIFRCSESH
jgi:hypothetical protein